MSEARFINRVGPWDSDEDEGDAYTRALLAIKCEQFLAGQPALIDQWFLAALLGDEDAPTVEVLGLRIKTGSRTITVTTPPEIEAAP